MKKTRRLHVVVGTKAQLIKMAPIMAELEKRGVSYNFIFTGQHRDTIDDLRANFNVKKPDVILHQGKDITSIFQMTLWLIKISTKIFFSKKSILGETDKNDVLLTHGDTFSTLLGALMGKLAGIKVAHVESGLRSFNLFHPFPEELTRIITFNLSDYYFCPGEWAVKNLAKYKGMKINTEHNTLLDSLRIAKENFDKSGVEIPSRKYCVCSIHRFENIFKKDVFSWIIAEIEKISDQVKVLFILHPPTVQQLKKFGLMERLEENKNIELRKRYDYLDFIKLLNSSEFLITDGGSNQEECSYLGKPCLIMRRATERVEGLGENVMLSCYDSCLIEEFIEDYQRYKKEELIGIYSPVKTIVDYLTT